MQNDRMTHAFFSNAVFLRDKFDIVPLMYGSLGLEYLTGHDFCADDIDILIPESFILERWSEFRGALEQDGYDLIDEHEHTFEKGGVHYSYARIEELEPFAGIPMAEIRTMEEEGIRFKLLSLQQYLKVYTASAKDGYRVNVREKKDFDKIRFIQKKLQESNT